jgi:hypothetical protein
MSEPMDRQHKTETEKLARLLKAHVIKIEANGEREMKRFAQLGLKGSQERMTEKRTKGRFSYREDRKLIQMAAGSATLEEAAVTFGTSVETIERKAEKLGLLSAEPDGRKRLSARLDLGLKIKK